MKMGVVPILIVLQKYMKATSFDESFLVDSMST